MKLSAQYPEIAEVMLALAWHRNHALLECLDNLRRRPLLVRTAQMLSANAKSQSDYQEVRCKQDELHSVWVAERLRGQSITTLQNEELIQLGYGKIIIPSAIS